MNNSEYTLENIQIIDPLITSKSLGNSKSAGTASIVGIDKSSSNNKINDESKRIWFELKGTSHQILATPFSMKPWEFKRMEVSLVSRGGTGHLDGDLDKPIMVYKLRMSDPTDEKERRVVGHSSPNDIINIWNEEEWRRGHGSENTRLHWTILILLTGAPILGPLYYYLIMK